MKKVMVFGTFDTIHPGHLHLFRQAKRYGDYLVVVVARDETVKKVKRKFPKNNEKKRLENLKTLNIVDKAVLGSLSDPYLAIDEYMPKYICIGYDQESFITKNLERELEKRYIKAKIIRLRAFVPDVYKSSKLR